MLKLRLRPYLEQLRTRQMTNRAVAKELGVSEEHLSRVLKTLITKEPAFDPGKRKELLAARRQHRIAAAQTLPVAEAARAAKCSVRTIYRLRK